MYFCSLLLIIKSIRHLIERFDFLQPVLISEEASCCEELKFFRICHDVIEDITPIIKFVEVNVSNFTSNLIRCFHKEGFVVSVSKTLEGKPTFLKCITYCIDGTNQPSLHHLQSQRDMDALSSHCFLALG